MQTNRAASLTMCITLHSFVKNVKSLNDEMAPKQLLIQMLTCLIISGEIVVKILSIIN